MSTLLGNGKNTRIRSESDLTGYFQSFSKNPADFKLGLEAEFLGVEAPSGQAIPYEGSRGIDRVFEIMIHRFGYAPVKDEGRTIAITKEDRVIALEPGSQIELSAPPFADLAQVQKHLHSFLLELRDIEREIPGLKWLAYGIQPFSRLEQIAWVPKRRYALLADYLKNRGSLSHHMMKRTATNQFNFDYKSEEHAMTSLRTALAITCVVSAMFANASFSCGELNGFASERLEIWNHTAPERSGLLTKFISPQLFRFQDYLDYILDMPMIFIVREGKWIPMNAMTMRGYIRSGHEGFEATLADFELHLSTAFPEVRIKQYLEVRGLDCQKPDLIMAAAAFWKGILYDDTAIAEAWDQVAFASAEDHLALRAELPRKGLKAKLGARPVLDLASQLFKIAEKGIRRQAPHETVFLLPCLKEILEPRQSPGEKLAVLWLGELQERPENLIRHLSLWPQA